MSQEAEKIKKLVAFKKKLEKRVEELESELNEQQLMLEAVNSILLEKGFKRAEIAKKPAEAEVTPVQEEPPVQPLQPSAESEKVISLKTVTGEALASLYVNEDSLRVVLAEDKNFNINTPPFTQFLVERVLAKMQEKDSELARTGQLTTDEIFSYTIIQEGDRIREIAIKNFDNNRLRELNSSIRWTLEKMYEKTKD
jgi:uncharacterized coiled-coil protein SlyX